MRYFYDTEFIEDGHTIDIPEHTRQLLIDLGWTPPTSETVEPAATPERTTA